MTTEKQEINQYNNYQDEENLILKNIIKENLSSVRKKITLITTSTIRVTCSSSSMEMASAAQPIRIERAVKPKRQLVLAHSLFCTCGGKVSCSTQVRQTDINK